MWRIVWCLVVLSLGVPAQGTATDRAETKACRLMADQWASLTRVAIEEGCKSVALRAIDYIGFVGAYPVVCIFRPLEGADMEQVPTPDFHDMVKVYRHVYKTCKAHRLPIGVAPNVNYSLSLQPEDTFYLASDQSSDRAYSRWLWMLRQVMRPRLTHRKPKK